MKELLIEVLYPELNHLYGDRGNLCYLKSKLEVMGVPYRFVETHLGEEPVFAKEEVDFLYIGPTTESYQQMEAEALLPYRDALRARMDSEKVTLMTGNAFELLGQSVKAENGEEFSCLGILPTFAKRFTRLRYNDLSLGTWQGEKIVGFKNQLSHSYVPEGKEAPVPFLDMQKGSGWNPDVKQEGFFQNFFFATYMIGPILPLNPGFSEKILKAMYPEIEVVPKLPYEWEAYTRRLSELEK